jgi:hypothetical protein
VETRSPNGRTSAGTSVRALLAPIWGGGGGGGGGGGRWGAGAVALALAASAAVLVGAAAIPPLAAAEAVSAQRSAGLGAAHLGSSGRGERCDQHGQNGRRRSRQTLSSR